MKTHLIVKISIAFAVGILSGFYELNFNGLLLVIFLTSASLVLLKRESVIFGILVFFILGYSLAYLQSETKNAFNVYLNKHVSVEGLVASDVSQSGRYRNFNLRLSKINANATSETVKVYTEERGMRTGDYLKAKGLLKEPQIKSVTAFPTFFCKEEIRPIGSNSFFAAIGNIRAKVKKIIMKERSDGRAFLYATITGQTNELSLTAKNDLRASGLTHLLAVSGFNVAFIIFPLFLFFRLINIRTGFQLVLIIITLFCYSAFTGFQPSVIRASIMASWMLAAYLLGRKSNWPSALSTAALMSLAIDPSVIFSVSFQLSYAAIISMFLFREKIFSYIDGVSLALKQGLSVSVSVQILTLPLIAFHFGEVPVFAVFANIIAVPLAVLAFYLAFLALAVSWIGFNIFLHVPTLLSICILKVAAFFNSFPISTISISPLVIVVLSVFLTLIFFFLANNKFQKEKNLSVNFAYLLIIVLAFVALSQLWQSSESFIKTKQLNVEFLDVGQGDATYIKGPGQEKVLIDSGPSPFLIQNHLIKRKVKSLDMVVASHADKDHISGLPQILTNFNVKAVLDNGHHKDSELYRDFRRVVKARKIKYFLARRGKIINVGLLKLFVLHPSNVFIEGTSSDDNNNAIVLKINYLKQSFLFTGDIGFEAEESLIQSQNLKANVLKVSHHGSALATSSTFLNAVKPNYAIISVGARNRYGHPRPSLINRLQNARAIICRTDISSDIKMSVDARGLRVDD